MGKYQIGNEMGFTLIDLIMASMISVIIVSICSSVTFFQFEQLRRLKALYMQNVLLAHVRLAINPKNIQESANVDPTNTELVACLIEIDGANCKSTEDYGFKLYDGGQLSGIPDEPVGYDLNGQRCQFEVDENCIFGLSTAFIAQCKDILPAPSMDPFEIREFCPGESPGLFEVFYYFDISEGLAKGRAVGLRAIRGSIIVDLN